MTQRSDPRTCQAAVADNPNRNHSGGPGDRYRSWLRHGHEIVMPGVDIPRLGLRDPALLDEFSITAVAFRSERNSSGNLGTDVLDEAHSQSRGMPGAAACPLEG